MMTITPDLIRVLDSLKDLDIFEKFASDSAEHTSAMDSAIATVKKAAMGPMVSQGLGMARNALSTPFGKGLGVAAGAAAPTALVGNHLIDNATESARDRALQAGAGLATIGAGVYGASQLMKRPNETVITHKRASAIADTDEAIDSLAKLASVGLLDAQLTTILEDTSLSPEAHKLASDVQRLNMENCINILRDLLG